MVDQPDPALSQPPRRQYQYQPLTPASDHIRLFKLDAASGLISGSLEVFSLATCPGFHALSYEWGIEQDANPIIIDGSCLNIRSNLMTFLHSYKSVAERRDYIWIDQICIDQESTIEKNHQVGLMSQIYSQADEVIAWLGTGLRRWLQWFLSSEYIERSTPMRWTRTTEDDEDFGMWSADLSSDGIKAIVAATYWSRLWIQQEVLLARAVVFASEQVFVPAEALRHAYDGSNSNGSLGWENRALYNAIKGRNGFSCFRHIVAPCLYKACLDPRDHVYAILGMVPAKDRNKIAVDYSRPVCEVFKEAVALLYEEKFTWDHGMRPNYLSEELGSVMGLCMIDVRKIILEV